MEDQFCKSVKSRTTQHPLPPVRRSVQLSKVFDVFSVAGDVANFVSVCTCKLCLECVGLFIGQLHI